MKGESHGVIGAHTTKFSGKKSFCWCRWVAEPGCFSCCVCFFVRIRNDGRMNFRFVDLRPEMAWANDETARCDFFC